MKIEIKHFITELKKLGWLKSEFQCRDDDNLTKQWEDDQYILQDD